ncbi:MAG: alkaline phosphatase family protein [Thermoplasmata archaeon]
MIVGSLFVAALLLLSSVATAGASWVPAHPPPSAGAPVSSPTYPTPIRHIIVIMDENEEDTTTLSEPYEKNLSKEYAYAANFWATAHDSPRDYVAATSGSSSDRWNQTVTSLAPLLDAQGESWAEYEEAMPYACDVAPEQPADSLYASGHNPFVRYQDVSADHPYCLEHELVYNAASFAKTLADGTLDSYTWITPDDCHDAHGTPAGGACPTGAATDRAGDVWLSQLIPKVIASPEWKSTAIFILYDEGEGDDGPNGTGGGHVYSVVVSGDGRTDYQSHIQYDTYDVLTTTEWLLGLGHTGLNDSWTVHPPMYDLFQSGSSSTFKLTLHVVSAATGSPVEGAWANTTVNGVREECGDRTTAAGYTSCYLRDGTYPFTFAAKGYDGQSRNEVVSGTTVAPVVRMEAT